MKNNVIVSRFVAVLEVVFVYFGLIWIPGYFVHPKLWQLDLLMIVVAVLLVLVPRRNLAEYGLNFANWKNDLSVGLTAYLPAGLAVLPTAFLDSTTWGGALIISITIIFAIPVIAWLLQRKLIPLMGIISIIMTILGFGISATLNGALPPFKTAIGNFITYMFFVGFGEEILFRGYIQSRLNQVFGKPFSFFGISWGMGLIITSMFFGFVHVLNGVPEHWYWAWGAWNVFSGLLLGLVREKTGSVLASSILHGLPFGLGRAFGL